MDNVDNSVEKSLLAKNQHFLIVDNFFIKRNTANDERGYIYPVGSQYDYEFDGEQEYGAVGAAYLYDVDYYELAKHAYTLVTVNEFARILISRLAEFVVGCGLKLHPQPMKNLLRKLLVGEYLNDAIAIAGSLDIILPEVDK